MRRLHFEKGVPVTKLDGVEDGRRGRSSRTLNALGGATRRGPPRHRGKPPGGRGDLRGVYETPGGAILYNAHEVLETALPGQEHRRTTKAETGRPDVRRPRLRRPVVLPRCARPSAPRSWTSTQETVTGDGDPQALQGQHHRRRALSLSPYSLYDPEIATFGEDDVYNQADTAGFIALYGLPIAVQRHEEAEEVTATNNLPQGLPRTDGSSARLDEKFMKLGAGKVSRRRRGRAKRDHLRLRPSALTARMYPAGHRGLDRPRRHARAPGHTVRPGGRGADRRAGRNSRIWTAAN